MHSQSLFVFNFTDLFIFSILCLFIQSFRLFLISLKIFFLFCSSYISCSKFYYLKWLYVSCKSSCCQINTPFGYNFVTYVLNKKKKTITVNKKWNNWRNKEGKLHNIWRKKSIDIECFNINRTHVTAKTLLIIMLYSFFILDLKITIQ